MCGISLLMKHNKKKASIEFSWKELIGLVIALILVIGIVELWLNLYGSTLNNNGNMDSASFYSLGFQIDEMLEDTQHSFLTEEGFPLYLSSDDPEYILVGFDSNRGAQEGTEFSIHNSGERIPNPEIYPSCGIDSACLCLYKNHNGKDFDDDDEGPLDCYEFEEDNIYFSGADGWDDYVGNGNDAKNGVNDAHTRSDISNLFTFDPSLTDLAYEYLLIYSKGDKSGCKLPDEHNLDICVEEYDEFGVRPLYIEKFVDGYKTHILIATQEGKIQERATMASPLEAQSVTTNMVSGTLNLPSGLPHLGPEIQAILSTNPGSHINERMIYAIMQQESNGDPNLIGYKILKCCQGTDTTQCALNCPTNANADAFYYVDSQNTYILSQGDISERVPQAYGVMQITIDTANDHCSDIISSQEDFMDSLKSIECSVRILENCIISVTRKSLTPERDHVLACYNGGPGALELSGTTGCSGQTIWECEGNSGYAQTRDYVQNVNGYYDSLSYSSSSSSPSSEGNSQTYSNQNLVDIDATIVQSSCSSMPERICKLNQDAYTQLIKAEEIATSRGYHLEVYSALRSTEYQRTLFLNNACNRRMVAGPSGISSGECNMDNPQIQDLTNFQGPHTTGGAIDIRLLNSNGARLASTDANRQIMEEILCEAGFIRYIVEHWHFEYGTNRWERGTAEGVCAIG